MSAYPTTIAIDGPAASGKTTVGRMLAEALDYLFLDTGCMYRAATLAALDANIDLENETAVAHLTTQLNMRILPPGNQDDGRVYTVLLDDQDVTWRLRDPAVDANVSRIASILGVRQELVRRQHTIGQQGQVVMVGRDIGTVVMPDAPLKLYVTASAEERARRRWEDRRDQGHEDADYDAILADVNRRDQLDGNRRHSPMRPADDAIILDTTKQSPAEVVQHILSLLSIPKSVS
ncbi:MAG TPA: (d)CMP kinase [Anaerolineae bacterium]|nr:(d)CMP kinase [Anaerolineae bacterium]